MNVNIKDNSIWQTIVDALRAHNFEVYPPATKKGECISKYIVVKKDGTSGIRGYSTKYVYYRILLYVPKNEYHELDIFEKEVRSVLDTDLFPLIMSTGSGEPDYYDDNINGHMRAFLYRNNVRDKHL